MAEAVDTAIAASTPQEAHKPESAWSQAWREFRRSPSAMVGLVLVLLLILSAIFAPLLAPADPYAQRIVDKELPPFSEGYLLGTDELGRDILSRLIFGARISLMVGLSAVTLGLLLGVTLGLISGYFSRLDDIIMRFIDILLAFPGVLLAIAIVAALGIGLTNLIIAIAIFSVPTFTRITRGSVLSAKENEYVTAARAVGAPTHHILLRHILPNISAPIIVYATLRIATAILAAAALSFLGLGADPSVPEWGAMVAAGRTYLYTAPHIATIPGLAIMVTVLAFNLMGDGLRDALDPQLRA